MIWDSAHTAFEETGQELGKILLCGMRMYPTNSFLAPHVDRMPLVTPAVINVVQDLEVGGEVAVGVVAGWEGL